MLSATEECPRTLQALREAHTDENSISEPVRVPRSQIEPACRGDAAVGLCAGGPLGVRRKAGRVAGAGVDVVSELVDPDHVLPRPVVLHLIQMQRRLHALDQRVQSLDRRLLTIDERLLRIEESLSVLTTYLGRSDRPQR